MDLVLSTFNWSHKLEQIRELAFNCLRSKSAAEQAEQAEQSEQAAGIQSEN